MTDWYGYDGGGGGGYGRTVRFKNDFSTPVLVRWEGKNYGTMSPGESVEVDTFPEHLWEVYDEGSGEALSGFVINDRRSSYRFSKYAGGDYAPKPRRSRKVKGSKRQDSLSGYKDMSYLDVPWVNIVHRGPCVHFIHEAHQVGHQQQAKTGHILETRSTHPRIFFIRNFLSPEECDHLIEHALYKGYQRSTVVGGGFGGAVSNSRTSSTAWLEHFETPVMENIFYRASDLLNIDPETLHRVSEDLQVVHYAPGQLNDAHQDTLQLGGGHDRLLTLLFYLKDPSEYGGGSTRFFHPGIDVKGQKGDAVLFYNMHPDGNLDELALHAGTALDWGEKIIANFWVWDQHRV